MMFRLTNPITLFIITWLFVLFLYSLGLSHILIKLETRTIFYISLTCFSFISSYLLCSYLYKRYRGKTIYFQNSNIDKNIKIIFYIWLSFTIVEIGYFRSLPLLALMGIGATTYTEWGIPSLHGILNALILVISNYNFYMFLTEKKRKYLYRFLLCLCWPILLVTRQVLLSMILQSAFVYLSINKLRTSTILKLICAAIGVIFLFGWIGDLRSGDPETFKSIAQPTGNYPSFLPSGFLWVYIYITTPLNNVNFNMFRFPDFAFQPVYVLTTFFPSFIRSFIFPQGPDFKFDLVEYWLNVSSMFPNYLSAFGYWGSLVFYFIMGCGFSVLYFKTKGKRVNVKWVFILVVILHNISFSVFVDFFASLPFVFQMIVHFLIGTKYQKSNEV